MEQKKIIFISNNPITIKIKELFQLSVFEENGFDVEYWDLSQFIDPSLSNLPDKLAASNIFIIKSFAEMKEKVLQNSCNNTVFLSGLDDYYIYKKIFKFLTKQNFVITLLNPYGGVLHFKHSLIDKIKRAFSSNIFKKINDALSNFYYNHLYKKIHNIDLTTYLFSSYPPYSFAINHPDYEYFTKIKNENTSIQTKPYIVFLDTYIPLHPDMVRFDALKYVEPKDYQKSMRDFFDKLEQKFNAEVIIAAHPKAKYDNNEFGNRKIIKYKTAELVKNAELVVSHMSNSTAFVILFNKPLIIVTTNKIETIPKFAFRLNMYANFFNKTLYNINKDDIEQMNFSKISDEIRDKYKYSYLTSPEIENMSNKDILVKAYNDIFEKIKNI